MPDCNIAAAGFKKVRVVRTAYGKWHPATDNLAGTDNYSIDGGRKAWTTPWSTTPFTYFLFISHDRKYWIVSTKGFLDTTYSYAS